MKKDVIIGCITDYTYDQIEPWVVSLEQTEFNGVKAMIVYNAKKDVVDKLIAKGFTIFGFERDKDGNFVYPKKSFSVVVERFVHLWFFLSQVEEEMDWIITTDVKDVIFQHEPVRHLEEQFNYMERDSAPCIVVAGEGLRYKDEPWSKNNMIESFGPPLYEHMKDKEIICAGVIAGKKEHILDLFLNVFLLCRGAPVYPPGGGGPDQSALNITLASKAYQDKLFVAKSSHGFATHLGTTLPAIEGGSGDIGQEYIKSSGVDKGILRATLLDNDPYLEGDKVVNLRSEEFAIVHQYDRVPGWKDIINKKYRE
jgi:hypothetical protein